MVDMHIKQITQILDEQCKKLLLLAGMPEDIEHNASVVKNWMDANQITLKFTESVCSTQAEYAAYKNGEKIASFGRERNYLDCGFRDRITEPKLIK